jgi:hypothetical protein
LSDKGTGTFMGRVPVRAAVDAVAVVVSMVCAIAKGVPSYALLVLVCFVAAVVVVVARRYGCRAGAYGAGAPIERRGAARA